MELRLSMNVFAKTTKPPVVEEWVDYYFFRRLAALCIPVFHKLGFSPNAVTTLSLFTGWTGAYLIWNRSFVAGALVCALAIVFDCCDGQLARLTGKTSPLGRVMDGVFDLLWVLAMWVAIFFSGAAGREPWLLGFMAVAGAFEIIHCWRFDGVKLTYLEMAQPDFQEKDLDYPQAIALAKEKFKRFDLFSTFLALAIAFQQYFFVRGKEEKQALNLTPEQNEKARKSLDATMSGYTWLGEGHHNVMLIIGVLFAPWTPVVLWLAFFMMIVPMNLWMLVLEKRFRTKYNKLKIEFGIL